MSSQKILWTALPKLVQPSRNKLQLSVHVAPRLDTGGADAKLAAFPDFLDWPATLAGLDFQVVFGDGTVRVPTRVSVPAAQSKYWTALFTKDTLVRGRDVQIPGGAIISYPAGRVVDYLKTRYTQILQSSPTEHLPLDQMIALFEDIAFAGGDGEKDRGALLHQIDQQRDNGFVDQATGLTVKANVFHDGTPPSGRDMLAVERYYTRADFDAEAPIVPPLPDFHQVLSLAGGHPSLQRLLGVVVDLEIDGFRDVAGAPNKVKVVPVRPPDRVSVTIDSTPWTMCTIASQTFLPTPLDQGELKNGQLRLGDENRFKVVQIDPDGAGLKNLNSARSAKLGQLKQTDDTPDTATVPSLRSGGIAVTRIDHAAHLGKAFARMKAHVEPLFAAKALVADPDPVLYAEDVTRGYYVDVWDGVSQEWRSLTRREGTLNFVNADEVPVPDDDEAAITITPVGDTGPSASDDLYLGESLFRWQGWSLAADQPGRLVNNADGLDDSRMPAAPPYPLLIDLKAKPKSLPRLRFGREYRIRMRAADLAGNSVPQQLAADPSEHDVVATIDFRRFEPVQSPDVLMRHARSEGDSNERVVIRSNYAKKPLAAEDRQVVPARTWQRQAEAHGLFDLLLGSNAPAGIDKTWYQRIVSRENVSLASLGQLDTTYPTTTDDKGEQGSYFVPQLLDVVPYLPDPLARGAALQGLPGTSAPFFVDFSPKAGAAWPDYRPFVLRVVEPSNANGFGPGAPPKLDEAPDGSRTLWVELPKADVLQVRLSSTLDPDDLSRLGLWDWAGGAIPIDDAKQGRVWLLTPHRLLTLVHAVRQPLAPVTFVDLSPTRNLGETFATLHDRPLFSRKSTAKVELLASWVEPVDDGPGTPDPALVPIDRKLAVTIPIDPTGSDSAFQILHPHEFGDTKHRLVTYTGVATTRFAEYFTERFTATIPLFAQLGNPYTLPLDVASDPDQLGEQPGVVVGATRVKNLVTGELLEEGTQDEVFPPPPPPGQIPLPPTADFWVDADAATITFGSTAPRGEQLEISFIEESITRETLVPATISIKSSARPAAPKIRYVVPTFRWQQTATTSKRLGGGLRVYLDRPWYSSGAGELLGALIWRGPVANQNFTSIDPPPELQGYVSEWGSDPMTSGAALPSRQLKASHFTLSTAAMKGSNLKIDESGLTVDVAGHAVQLADPNDQTVISNFDPARGLYYCDIDLEQGNAYWPFVRLALAAYQPESLAGVELSRVVLADYAQLAPDRALAVVQTGTALGGAPIYQLTLSGPSNIEVAGRFGYGGARVMIEKKNAGKPTNSDIAWGQSGPPIQMTPGGGSLTNQLFTATVTLPGPATAGLYRLVVEQWEPYDQGAGQYAVAQLGERIVHQDIFPINPARLTQLG